MNLKDLKLNDIIKIVITIAITAILTFNIQISITNNNYDHLSNDVKDVKHEIKTIKNDTEILKENITKSIGIQNKILKEVD